MKVVIAGGRDFGDHPDDYEDDFALMVKSADHLLSKTTRPVIIVSGGARGADTLGEHYAALRGYALERYPADWKTYGASAGLVRNGRMAEISQALIAFWDGRSTGTAHMISLCRRLGLVVRVVRY